MQANPDHYEAYYADKLWQLLPAVYRAEDAEALDQSGPLREMVNRIGAQAAILRRGIDRLWEDQSIETCDDWVIAYIADLLATNLVGGLDARGQRLDVAKTIYYRRRKGTLAVLEEIAANITGWDARVVEFFRRLGRTRHNFDPPLGLPTDPDDAALRIAEQLVGSWTASPMGGWADLRYPYGASRAHTAFSEYSFTAEFRRGQGQTGWHNIPRLGVFLWRLRSYGVVEATPVPVSAQPGQYTFDPTGREIPLFAKAARRYGDRWASPEEWQMPTVIDTLLWQVEQQHLYPESLGVYQVTGSFTDPLDPAAVTIEPWRGRFTMNNPAANDQILTSYHYGFASEIGAGPYDRRILHERLPERPQPEASVYGGGTNLAGPLGSLAPAGAVSVMDSLTYTAVPDIGAATAGIQQVTLRADNLQRPLIRLSTPAWTFTGAPATADRRAGNLTLEGVFISGADVVLAGHFDTVTLTCCTLDPGSVDESTGRLATAVDGKPLAACHLYVEAEVRLLRIERGILGPIQTRNGGEIERLRITDSIIQALDQKTTPPAVNDRAFALSSGTLELSRCTLLGPASVHRLEVSECLLDDITTVEDAQHGCVRFSAWATGSVLPRQYESVEVAPRAPLFTSRVFGRPGYGQLLATVDRTIVSGAAGKTISAGATDGSEMGAFALEKQPIKERALRIKYEEYMPLGLVPVIVSVDQSGCARE